MRRGRLIELGEDVAFDGPVFNRRFDHEVGVRDGLVLLGRKDQTVFCLLNIFGGASTFFDVAIHPGP
jgi:hypothetical protein